MELILLFFIKKGVNAGVRITTNRFNLSEVELLANILTNKFNLNSTIQKIYLENKYSL